MLPVTAAVKQAKVPSVYLVMVREGNENENLFSSFCSFAVDGLSAG